MVGVFEILVFILALTFLCYKFSTRNFDYWKKKNVPYKKPLPFVGNFLDVFALRTQMGYLLGDLYNQFETPYFGLFVLNKPYFVIRSPELIRSVLVKDFNNFSDRTAVSDEKCDSMASKMLFIAKNPLWKALRTKMTPVFTTGKIKSMLNLLNQSGEEMILYLEKHSSVPYIEAKEVCAKYATDVIASCAFGISAHSFRNEAAEFRAIGRQMFDLNLKTATRQLTNFLAPSLVKIFRIPFFDAKTTTFMRDVFWSAIHTRSDVNFKRNDLIDIIIQMRNEINFKDAIKFEGDAVVAQAGQFFAAGFETVASTISFTLYELCLSSQIQERVRSEIKKVLASRKMITYDAIQEMKFLHMAICETLRKYPVLPFLDRMCMEDYKVPGSDVIIDKGTPVYIPMFGLHYDSKYFPNPEVYDPERFSDANKAKIPNFVYIPFGDGPRNCIGERFGLLATKMGLIHILSNFLVDKSANTPVPIVFDNRSVFLMPKAGVPMKFSRRRMSVAG